MQRISGADTVTDHTVSGDVSHFYGLFSATQGLPLSHVVLANTEEAVSRFKESLLGVGRLAATVSSSSPRSKVFRFNLTSKTYVGMTLPHNLPFFVLLVDNGCCTDLVLKCIQIGHVLHLLHGAFLTELSARIERDLAVALNNASFARGREQDDDCDMHYEERFSVVEDHYIRPILTISHVRSLYTAPISNCGQIQSLLGTPRNSPPYKPPFPFTFGLYMLHPDSAHDFEIPLAGPSHHSLLFDHCTVFRELLHFYRVLYMEERIGLAGASSNGACLQQLLSRSLILQLDSCAGLDDGVALIVSATHSLDMYVAMSVPTAWLDPMQQAPSDHQLLARVPSRPPVHLPGAGLSLLPLEALAGPAPAVLECWTALLSRFMLYMPSQITPKGDWVISNVDVHDDHRDRDSDGDGDAVVFSVDQVAALLTPPAPDPRSLGSLRPHPPLEPRAGLSSHALSRPSPSSHSKEEETAAHDI